MKQKIFNNNLNNLKTIVLREKIGDVGKIKYLPSFSKEWKNIIYSYNKNNSKNIPVNTVNINKIIKSYFNLCFKNYKYIGSKKFIHRRRKRRFLKRIYVSNAEIKHTNDKAIITLYILNKEKKTLKKKYFKINNIVNKKWIKDYLFLYQSILVKRFNKHKSIYENLLNTAFNMPLKKFLKFKLEYLNEFTKHINKIHIKKISNNIKKKYKKRYLKLLRKYDLLYSLNQYKFNKQMFLHILSKILNKIIGKKIEYNIINLKSITYNTDIMTNVLALKLKRKNKSYAREMDYIINKAKLPPAINILKKRESALGGKAAEWGSLKPEFKDLKIISNLNKNNLSDLLNNLSSTKEIHSTIYNSISYKNIGGIRLEVNGRLTKRKRAEKSISLVKWKGGLKNVDSLSKQLSSVLFRGKFKSNVSYSLFKSKRRIGAFAVKGWISGIS